MNIHIEIGPGLYADLEAVAPDESPAFQLHIALDQRAACIAALTRLLNAAEGLDQLYDDESRAEAYATELYELSQAKDQAREALAIGIPTRETVNRNARNQATT